MTYALALNTILTCLLVIVPDAFRNGDENTIAVSYSFVLILAGLFGFSVAFLQVTLYGVSGPSAEHTAAFMVGIGASGIIINLLRILLLLIIPSSVTQAYIIFSISTAFLAFCTYLSHRYVQIKNYENVHNSEVIRDFQYSKSASTWDKIKNVYRKNRVSAFSVCLTFAI